MTGALNSSLPFWNYSSLLFQTISRVHTRLRPSLVYLNSLLRLFASCSVTKLLSSPFLFVAKFPLQTSSSSPIVSLSCCKPSFSVRLYRKEFFLRWSSLPGLHLYLHRVVGYQQVGFHIQKPTLERCTLCLIAVVLGLF